MAWSCKLISGAGGVAGYNEWELVFDPSTQTAYKATYNISLGSEAPDVLYHTPDNGSPVPIRATGNNRVVFLEMHIPTQTSWDNVLNKIAPIARLVDGADSQAMRAQTGGADKVRVAIKPDGATNTTYFDVLHGFIDTSQAFTQAVSIINTTAYRVTIALTCSPFGYGDSFTLRNSLPSSPHMIEDGNADGLADGLTLVGAPTPTIATNRYLTGGKAQKLTTDNASNQGIQTDAVLIAPGTAVVGYVDLTSSGDRVSIILRDDVGVIQTKTITTNDGTAASSRSYVDPFGAVFYRIELSGNTTALSVNCYVQVRRVIGDATQATQIWIDKIYLQTGTSTVPPAFVSSGSLKNRNDPAATTAATRQQINYLDVWGIPGDVPAYVRQIIDVTAFSSKATSWAISKVTSGRYDISDYKTVFAANDARWAYSASWASAADTNIPGGTRYELNSSSPSTTYSAILTLTGQDALDFVSKNHRVFALCYITTTPANEIVSMLAYTEIVPLVRYNYQSSNNVPFPGSGEYKWLDLGLIVTEGTWPDELPDVANLNFMIEIDFDGVPSATTLIYFGGLYIMPLDNDDGFSVFEITTPVEAFWVDGKSNSIIDGEIAAPVPHLSIIETLMPGVGNRLTYAAVSRSDNEYDIDVVFNTSLLVTPRTSHLLGTV